MNPFVDTIPLDRSTIMDSVSYMRGNTGTPEASSIEFRTRYRYVTAEEQATRPIEKLAGQWLIANARAKQARHGTQHAALSLRKRGVPLSLALAILRGTP